MNNANITAATWYSYDISEYERYVLVGHIQHATEYGRTKTFQRLPKAAKLEVEKAFRKAITQ